MCPLNHVTNAVTAVMITYDHVYVVQGCEDDYICTELAGTLCS